jgi:hypothetical protein
MIKYKGDFYNIYNVSSSVFVLLCQKELLIKEYSIIVISCSFLMIEKYLEEFNKGF